MKPTLTEKPSYIPITRREVILQGDLVYEDTSYIVRVYDGYKTDGGSLPRLSWTFLGITPFSPSCVFAFFLHDFLYQSQLLTRRTSDGLLYTVLSIPPRCNFVQRWLIWSHVRLYGWIPWRNKTPRTITEGRKFGEVIRKRHLHRSAIK